MALNDINFPATHASDDGVEATYDEAIALASEDKNPWPAMTYIQGVRDTLAWLTGDQEEGPLDELIRERVANNDD